MLSVPDPAARLAALRASDHPQAQFVWSVLRDSFHYSAVHLSDIADTARLVDEAVTGGVVHSRGPFEIWQAAGWHQVAQWVADDISQGKALCDAPLPEWVSGGFVWEAQGVQTAMGSWNPGTQKFEPRSPLPVYERQIGVPLLVGELNTRNDTIVFDNDALRRSTLPAPHPQDVLILSFKSKMHTLGL